MGLNESLVDDSTMLLHLNLSHDAVHLAAARHWWLEEMACGHCEVSFMIPGRLCFSNRLYIMCVLRKRGLPS